MLYATADHCQAFQYLATGADTEMSGPAASRSFWSALSIIYQELRCSRAAASGEAMIDKTDGIHNSNYECIGVRMGPHGAGKRCAKKMSADNTSSKESRSVAYSSTNRAFRLHGKPLLQALRVGDVVTWWYL